MNLPPLFKSLYRNNLYESPQRNLFLPNVPSFLSQSLHETLPPSNFIPFKLLPRFLSRLLIEISPCILLWIDYETLLCLYIRQVMSRCWNILYGPPPVIYAFQISGPNNIFAGIFKIPTVFYTPQKISLLEILPILFVK